MNDVCVSSVVWWVVSQWTSHVLEESTHLSALSPIHKNDCWHIQFGYPNWEETWGKSAKIKTIKQDTEQYTDMRYGLKHTCHFCPPATRRTTMEVWWLLSSISLYKLSVIRTRNIFRDMSDSAALKLCTIKYTFINSVIVIYNYNGWIYKYYLHNCVSIYLLILMNMAGWAF